MSRLCLSRRAALQTGLVGGLVVAFQWPLHAAPANEPEQPPDHPGSEFVPNAFIRIDESGKTTLVIPQAEMGQGVYTAIAMILPKSWTPTWRRSCSSMRHRATGSTAIRFSACR